MQKIYFEKWIDLNHQLSDLLSLSVDESINYKIESVGVRAIGSLIVKGEYNEAKKFEESIDIDILAAFDKIVDQRDFNIKVEDFDYFINDGDIRIKIEVGIHGVIEGEDRYVKDEHFRDEDTLQEIESLIREVEPEHYFREEPVHENKSVEEPVIKEEPVVKRVEPKIEEPLIVEDTVVTAKEEAVANDISEQLQEKVYPSKARPIFQDTTDSIGTYYLYIVRENDSYSDVANRYNIDEEIIRSYNQDKGLEPGSVLIIPYVP